MIAKIGLGVYTFPEAARLTGLRTARVREWFRSRDKDQTRRPVFRGDYLPVQGDFALSFLDLVDVYVAGQLREHGVSLQTLRKVYAKMQKDLNTCHPFGRKELLSDGKVVFMRNVDKQGQEELTEVLTNQGVFPEIILPFLETIDYEKVKLLARRWRIAEKVVLDPTICLGQPVIAAAGIPTNILASAYHANDNQADLVADWYHIQPGQVLAAVQFEKSIAA